MENEEADAVKGPLPAQPWAGGEGIPQPRLLLVVTGPGTRVL